MRLVGCAVLLASLAAESITAGWDDGYRLALEASLGDCAVESNRAGRLDAVADARHYLGLFRDSPVHREIRARVSRFGASVDSFRIEAYGRHGQPYKVVWALDRGNGRGVVFWSTNTGKLRSRSVSKNAWQETRAVIHKAMENPLQSGFKTVAVTHVRPAFVSVRLDGNEAQFVLNPSPADVPRPGERWPERLRELSVFEQILRLCPDRDRYWLRK